VHDAAICVHSDGCGAALTAVALCLPPRPRLLGARAACPAGRSPMLARWCRSPRVGLLGTPGPGGEAQGQAHVDSPRFRCPLPGLRSCCHPARSSHRPHLCLPGTAAQIFWDQSGRLSRRDGTLPRPGGVSVRVTAEIPEPLSPVWGQRCSPCPSSPLPCLASACGQPVPDSLVLCHPVLSISVTSGTLLGLLPPCTVGLGFFLLCSHCPRVLPLPPSALSCAGLRERNTAVLWGTGLGGLGGQQPRCTRAGGRPAPSLPCPSEAAAGWAQPGPALRPCLWPRVLRAASQPRQTPPASARPKLTSARRLLGSSGTAPRTNDDGDRTPG